MSERSEREALERMRELLQVGSQEELEAAVPDRHVEGMWTAVRDARPAPRSASARRRWLVPTLAAASVTLTVLVGGLAVERAGLLERQTDLERRLAGQEHRLALLERAGSHDRPSPLSLVGAPPWARELARRGEVSLGRVRELLAAVPPETTLLAASELEAVGRGVPFTGSTGWPVITSGLYLADGLQAGELLDALEALELGDGTPIPTARVLEIYRAARNVPRS